MGTFIGLLNGVAFFFFLLRVVDKGMAWWRKTFPYRIPKPQVRTPGPWTLQPQTGAIRQGAYLIISDGESISFSVSSTTPYDEGLR